MMSPAPFAGAASARALDRGRGITNPADVSRQTYPGPEVLTVGVDPALARRNALLDGLDDDDLAELLPDMRHLPLPAGLVLQEPGEPVEEVQFPLVGVVSVVADLGLPQLVETATIGREGMVGISVFLAGIPTERALVQVPGEALAMTADALRARISAVDGPLTLMLRRSTQALFTQVSRNSACNRVHSIRRRAARWLLMTADRMDSPSFELTQHFLAQMLAVRRTSVSEVAQALAEDGCIVYTRGTITILDRPLLESNACDCYEAIRTGILTALADP